MLNAEPLWHIANFTAFNEIFLKSATPNKSNTQIACLHGNANLSHSGYCGDFLNSAIQNKDRFRRRHSTLTA